MIFRKIKENGISLRFTYRVMIIVTVVIAALLFSETFLTTLKHSELSNATDNYIALQNSAYDLMNASDYLTEEVQCYTVTGERAHMENYFYEAEVSTRREKAIDNVARSCDDVDAVSELELAMSYSVELMNDEYYAMRLVSEAHGESDMPQAVKNVTLKPEDKALSADEKMKKASEIVHSNDYLKVKNTIRNDMNNCLSKLEEDVKSAQQQTDQAVARHSLRLKILIITETAAIIFVLWITTHLVIKPILKGVKKIREDKSLSVIGSYELRYLAKTYNKMYDAFKKSIASLNYDASHDKLTGVYNRAGYDVLKQNIDVKTSAVLLIDADNFKSINDTYGHTVGDCVLKKIANTLTNVFRSDDLVCRIGGDEFAIFMFNITKDLRMLIENKVTMINETLSDTTADSLPSVTLSVGVAFGKFAQDVSEMIEQADMALYKVKERGRRGCCFYSP